MPKLKSNRGAKKRFKITGSGKIKRKRAYLRHILSSKTKKQKRKLRSRGYVDSTNESHVRQLLPTG